MKPLRGAAQNKAVRALGLPLLKAISRDVTIQHHWTGDPINLHLFRHKGYWFYGKRREHDEMRAIQALVSPGDLVAEVGAHIGYLSLWFVRQACTDSNGVVYAFEPGPNNLSYLRRNLANSSCAVIVEAGCGSEEGVLTLFTDDLTGQNNSYLQDFEGLEANRRQAPLVKVTKGEAETRVHRLDTFPFPRVPSFLKIDTEGYEMPVLRGAAGLLRAPEAPIVMVEVQADQGEVFESLVSNGYELWTASMERINSDRELSANVFAVKPDTHSDRLDRWCRMVKKVH